MMNIGEFERKNFKLDYDWLQSIGWKLSKVFFRDFLSCILARYGLLHYCKINLECYVFLLRSSFFNLSFEVCMFNIICCHFQEHILERKRFQKIVISFSCVQPLNCDPINEVWFSEAVILIKRLRHTILLIKLILLRSLER